MSTRSGQRSYLRSAIAAALRHAYIDAVDFTFASSIRNTLNGVPALLTPIFGHSPTAKLATVIWMTVQETHQTTYKHAIEFDNQYWWQKARKPTILTDVHGGTLHREHMSGQLANMEIARRSWQRPDQH